MGKFEYVIVFYACLQALITATSSQQDEKPLAAADTRRIRDPVASFFSELGNMFLDIDKSFAEQIAPFSNLENAITRKFRPRQPRKEHFERIRENYRDIQKRVGSSLAGTPFEFLTSSDLFGINVQSKGPKTFVDVSLPFLPLKISLNSRVSLKDSLKNREGKSLSSTETGAPSSEETSNSDETPSVETTTHYQPETSTLDENANSIPEKLVTRFGRIPSLTEESLMKTSGISSGDVEMSSPGEVDADLESLESKDQSGIQGRILGDVLYSESTFDAYMKHLLDGHAKLILDPKIFPSQESIQKAAERLSSSIEETRNSLERVVDRIFPKTSQVKLSPEKKLELTTEVYVPISTEAKQKLKEGPGEIQGLSGTPDPIKAMQANFYDLTFESEDVEPPEIILQSEPSPYAHEEEESEPEGVPTEADIATDSPIPEEVTAETLYKEHFEKYSTLLAFTPDGVPLKLRISSDLQNPIKFLHNALSRAGVSLNIPVESYNDIEPVGKEILQLGAGSGGIITRALYLDLSNEFELNSLLRSLRYSKYLRERKLEEES